MVRSMLAALFAAAVCGTQALAHDWWLEPSAYSAPVGARVEIAGFVGVAFRGERVACDPAHVERFELADPQGRLALDGQPGAANLGAFVPRVAGAALVAYWSRPTRLYMKAPEFEKYLADEGLESVVARRAERGQSQRMGLEQYSRCAKALLEVRGDATPGSATAAAPAPAAAGFDQVVGLPLEFVPENDPRTLVPAAVGATFRTKLLFHGAPLAGTLVMALERDHPDVLQKVRTDGDGRARFELPHAGVWLVKCVQMVEARKETRLDWESFWASLTFEVPARPTPAASSSVAIPPSDPAKGR